MPTYLGDAISIRLSVTDLSATTHPSTEDVYSSELTGNLQRDLRHFRAAEARRTLSEVAIPDDGQWPGCLRFLGRQKNMPFFLVKSTKKPPGISHLTKKSERKTTDSSMVGMDGSGDTTSALSEEEDPVRVGSLGVENETTLTSSPSPEIYYVVQSVELPAKDTSVSTSATMPRAGRKIVKLKIGVRLAKILAEADDRNGPSRRHRVVSSTWVNKGRHLDDPSTARGRQVPAGKARFASGRNEGCLFTSVSSTRLAHQPSVNAPSQTKPEALFLTVKLTKEAFIRQPDATNIPGILDLKIDVYFNGELCGSSYVPERMRLDSNIAELTQRFSGHRIDRLLEWPWIIAPAGRAADGPLREFKRSSRGYVGAGQRWNEINNLLRIEAEKGTRNQWGELGQLGQYLESLADLDMPREVENIQKPGGPRFGIVDVVLTTGRGKKDEPDKGYLNEPKSLRINEFAAGSKRQRVRARPSKLVATPQPKTKNVSKSSADAAVIAQGFLPDTSRSATGTRRPTASCGIDEEGSSMPNASRFQTPMARSSAAAAVRRLRSGGARSVQDDPKLCMDVHEAEHLPYTPVTASPRAAPSSTTLFTCPSITSMSRTKRSQQELSPLLQNQGPKRHRGNADEAAATLGSPPPSSSQGTRKPTRTPPGKPKNVPTKTYKGADDMDGEPRTRRSGRMNYQHVMTDELTESEQFQHLMSIASQTPGTENACFGTRGRRATRGAGLKPPTMPHAHPPPRYETEEVQTPGPDTSKVTSVLRASRRRKNSLMVTFKANPPPTKPQTPGPSTQASFPAPGSDALSSPLSTPPTTRSNTPLPTPPVLVPAAALASGGVCAKPRRRARMRRMTQPSTWTPPAAHDDCVATYAPGRRRQVRAERSGWFQEQGVLLGVRFVIG